MLSSLFIHLPFSVYLSSLLHLVLIVLMEYNLEAMSLAVSTDDLLHLVFESSKDRRPSFLSLQAYWRNLLRWIQGQMIFDKKILIPGLGFIINVQIGETKTLTIQLLETFVKEQGIKHKEDIHKFTRPIISLHYTAISKMLQTTEEPQLLPRSLDRVFKTILEHLKKQNIVLDLGPLGKMILHEKVLSFQPSVTYKRKHEQRVTVSQLIVNKENSFRIKTKMGEITELDQSSIRISKSTLLNQSLFKPEKSLSPFSSPKTLKKTPKSDFATYLDMLGEISDPMGHGYNFSELASSPSELLETRFVKSDFCKPRFPPILDGSVHTIASPINNQKYNLSICGRVACNYNISARALYFDKSSRHIRKYVLVEGIKFKAQPLLLETPATDSEEIQFLEGRDNCLLKKVLARRKCFQRYNDYILKLIPFNLVTPVDKRMIKRILQRTGVSQAVTGSPRLTEVVDETLATVVRDYYYAGRKAILDYVLMDPDERERIGIVEILEGVPTWGRVYTSSIKFSDSMKEYIGASRQLVGDKLLMLPSTRKIMAEWGNYENDLFVSFSKRGSVTNLLYFVKTQQERMAEVRNNLRGRWYESVSAFIKEDNQSSFSVQRATSFHKSTNALIFNLLKALIERSLLKCLEFFQTFRKEHYYTVEEIIGNPDIVEHAFIVVKLKDENQEVVFAEDLQSHVKSELLSLLTQIINESKNFPSVGFRQSSIWEVSEDDQIYLRCYSQIELTIHQNLVQISRSLLVYQKYQHLLNRQGEVKEWCEGTRTIQDYTYQIEDTKKLYTEVLEELPLSVRMNMVVVDGSDLKRKFLSILSQVEQQLYESVYCNIKTQYNEIKARIQTLKAALSPCVDSTLKLLEMQSEIYRIKKVEIPDIKEHFKAVRLWMNLLFKYGSPLLAEADLLQIYHISRHIGALGELLGESEQRIAGEKEEIERKLRKETLEFHQSLVRLAKELEQMVQQFTIRKQYTNYNKTIKQMTKKFLDALGIRETINFQEEHLGWVITKFSQIEQINKTLQPISEFWSIVAAVDVQLKEWRTQPVKNLLPEDVESTLEYNLQQLEKINLSQSGTYFLPYKVFTQIRNQLLDMQQKYLSLIRIFANKGLKQRHWESFAKEFSICENKETLSLNKIISYKIVEDLEKIDVLGEISEGATREFNVERARNEMAEEWATVVIEVREFAETGILVVGSDMPPLVQLLETQILKIQGMKQLEQSKIFEQSLDQWQSWLTYTQSLFIGWGKVQTVWTYLFPLFSLQHILENFPLEHSQFESISNSWKSVMRRISEQPKVTEFTKNKKMLDIFVESNLKLSVMHNTIKTYLDNRGRTEGSGDDAS